jgi:mono/diheme cytochrome c family protein
MALRRPRIGPLGLALIGLTTTIRAADEGPDKAMFQQRVAPLLAKHCTSCHGGEKPKGGLDLLRVAGDASGPRARGTWEAVLDRIESGDMPPPDRPRPTEAEVTTIRDWIARRLSRPDCLGPADPGRVTLRRLNRAEYNNTVRDLVGIDFKPADDFPSDDVGYGFDNIGDVLSLPPILLEKYFAAAERIVEQAIVVDERPEPPTRRREAEDLPARAGGTPVAKVGRALDPGGRMAAQVLLSQDGEYAVRVRAFGRGGPGRMALTIDDRPTLAVEVAATEQAPGVFEARAILKSGRRNFVVTHPGDESSGSSADSQGRSLVVDWIEARGPYPDPAALPESHRRILFRRPTDQADQAEVARAILERFASRAFRRPATPDEVAALVKLVALAGQNGDRFEQGIRLAVQAVLVSPHFLFRVERGRPDAPSAGPVPLTDWELASRLSYFLWSSMPDDELFELARRGTLHTPEVLDAQVGRMLKDPRSRALVENFAGQWLQLRNLKGVSPDRDRYPDFDEPLRAAMRRETELFFDSILREDRSILEFLDADYTFVNERLARHYGLSGIRGEAFRRVRLEGVRRGGLITQASVLTVTSNPTRTSPVKRGKWILEQILGTPPPPPPPDVPELKDDAKGALSGTTLRQRMEQHRANPNCASCHARLDPIGFGLENYDAIGAWRERDGDQPIDASGALPSGRAFRGSDGLKRALKERPTQFARCLTEKMLTYAIGRGLDYPDRCVVDRVVGELEKDGHRFARLVREIVKSDPFLKRTGREEGR